MAALATTALLWAASTSVAALPACGGAATKDWVGPATGGSWQAGANWDGGAVPGAGDDVCIAGTGTVTHLGATTTIASLQTSGMGLTMSSGTLSVASGADPSTIRGPLTLSGGTLDFDGGADLDSLSQTGGTLDGAGQITLDGPGPFTWNAGNWQGTAQVLVSPGRTLTLGTAGTKNLLRPLLNRGTTTLTNTGGSLTIGSGVTLTNGTTGAPGLLQLQGDLTIGAGGGASITNSAESTITKPTGTGTTTIGAALTNTGTLDITTGTLSLNTAATNTGSIQLAGNTLVLSGIGTHSMGGIIQATGNGTVRLQANTTITGTYQVPVTELQAGTLTFPNPQTLPAFTQTGGTLDGAGQITLDGPGPFTWNAGNWQGTAQVLVSPGRTLTLGTAGTKNLLRPLLNRGTTTLNNTGGSLTIGSGVTLTNGTTGAPGLLQLQGDLTIGAGGGASITNSAESTITKPTGTGTTTIGAALTNTGTLDITTGTLTLLGPFTNFAGTTLTGGTYRIAGVLRFTSANVATDAAQIVLDGPGAAVQDTVGTNGLRNLASITPAGSLTVRNGASATTTAALANSGTLTIGSGSALTAGGTVTNAGLIQGSGQLTIGGGSGTLTSTGTVRPGTGPGGIGTLGVAGNYQQQAGGSLEVDIAGETAGTTHDRLAVSGSTSLGGTLAIVTAPGYTPALPTAHTVVTGAPVTGTFATVTGRVGVLGGRYTVDYLASSVTLRFAPPAVTVTVPSTLDLGTLSIGSSGAGSVAATVENTYRGGYALSVGRTSFPAAIPLRMELLGAPAGAELLGVSPGVPFTIPVNPAPGQSLGRRLGGPAPEESGLTPEGGSDSWQITVTGGPVGWAPAGTHTTTVTFTAITL